MAAPDIQFDSRLEDLAERPSPGAIAADLIRRQPLGAAGLFIVLAMIFMAVFVLVNFLVDLLYAWLDPRIRYS